MSGHIPKSVDSKTAAALYAKYEYNPSTGIFRNRNSGKEAGSLHPAKSKRDSYLIISMDGRYHLLHRVAFYFMTGRFPERSVDHIDRCGTNNKWGNLREVTHSENQRNRRLNKNNRSGIPGVRWEECTDRWIVSIGMGIGPAKKIGRVKDFFEACCLRMSAQNKHW
jgi:hypothetical protein